MEEQKKKTVQISPKASIVIDSREEYVTQEFVKKYPDANQIRWERKLLPVGDIWFNYGDNPIILIERKTLSDLNSSIKKDNRYKEQKLRIIDSKIPQKYYIVEGNLHSIQPSKLLSEDDKDRLYSAVINTTIRDRIPVLRTESLKDTIKTLEKIYDSLEKHGPIIWANSQLLIDNKASATPYAESLRSSKKDNMTPDICYLAQLMQIPGVSATVAQRIKEEYPNFKTLLSAYEKASDNKTKQKLLANLVLANNRKLGPVVSDRVYEFLLGNN